MDRVALDAILKQSPQHQTSLRTPVDAPHVHRVMVSDEPTMPEESDRHCFRIAFNGELELQHGAYLANIGPRAYYLTNPGRHVRCIGFNGSRSFWMLVAFAPDTIKALHHRRSKNTLFYELRFDNEPEVISQARKLAVLASEGGALSTEVQAGAEKLLLLLLRAQSARAQLVDRIPARSQKRREDLYIRLHRARDFINARFMDDPNVEDLADVAHLSRSHFLRMYKAAFESTPHQDLLDRKLQAACDMLATSRYSVTEISDACGFGNRCAFSRLFGQRFGQSPRDFRKQALGEALLQA